MLKLNNRGDTIVEVLIAVVVLGGVLGMAFATANRSSKATQMNYERYQAQIIANNQAELLRVQMDATLPPSVKHNQFGIGVDVGNLANMTNLNCFNNANAKATGNACENLGDNSLYTVQIECLNGGGSLPCANINAKYQNYRIHVEWDSLNGGKDNVELFYGT